MLQGTLSGGRALVINSRCPQIQFPPVHRSSRPASRATRSDGRAGIGTVQMDDEQDHDSLRRLQCRAVEALSIRVTTKDGKEGIGTHISWLLYHTRV